MIPNNNLSILPFYSSLEEQNHKKSYAYGVIYKLIAPNAKILPFQIVRDHSASTPITSVKLINFEANTSQEILSHMNTAGLHVKEFASENYDLIINPSALIFETFQIDAGKHYLEITDGTNSWFSDLFTVVTDLSPYLKIEYWDRDQIVYSGGHIDYTAPYKNYCFVQSEIGKPEYPFEETAQKRDGYLFVEKQISEKKYKFEFLAPEYLCDALRVVRMHDFINIYFKGKKYSVENIIFDPKWKDQGDLAVVETEFECDTVIKKIGKAILPTNDIGTGDFNYDYNSDFNN